MSEINKKTDAKGELKSVERFSSRAAEYARHRPSYPQAALDRLEEEGWIEIGTKVADVGSGTGIFSEQLMGKGCRVWAIEPSSEMRGIAEAANASRGQFHSVTGDAGSIPLDDDAVDLICAAQAFHWFDVEAARKEFLRISEPPHRVALLWNIRDREGSPFMEGLREVVERYAVDFDAVSEAYDDNIAKMETFFGGTEADGQFTHETFAHSEEAGQTDLLGLVTSFSYMPKPSDDDFGEMIEDLQELFTEHAEDGVVEILYETPLYWGLISP